MTERLDKLLAARGAGTRSEVKRWIRRGQVTVDGEIVKRPEAQTADDAALACQGEPFEALPRIVAHHKTAGVHSTTADALGRATLAEALPPRWRGRLQPVGRLDAETTGLILFSSDGTLTQRLLHPRRAVEREYEATVEGGPEFEALRAQLSAGVATADGVHTADVVSVTDSVVRLVVRQGRHRMVRRMLANAGFPVTKLVRLRFGEIRIGALAEGEFRPLDAAEAAWLDGL